ncbi:deoxyribose-phosphate aldolase [Yeosuana sp.]|uniref:deoxyribose-phosphate aldolase n=1 Tax=Yeosuana sp. TaxID=2529388 RepID=UPI004054FAE3|tara:strand:+ start:1076 stop:1738 length:663 start_codon:yes stop_codon:yes gene_type:complete
MEINSYLDFTLLNSSATERDVLDLCNDAMTSDVYSININSYYVPFAKKLLNKSAIKICSVVGFPLGAMSTQSKAFEAKKAVENGADEIDMVINIGFLKSKNYLAVLKDIIDVKLAINGKPLKVIIEISELSKNEIIKACEICVDAKADYIKTSSGLSNSGATLTAVKIIKKTVRDRIKIVAAGGINTIELAKKYINVGVHRISTTSDIKFSKNQLSSETF